jgi:hypothetical protein
VALPVRPDLPDPLHNTELMRTVMDLRTGTQFVVRVPAVRESFADVLARRADLLVSHPPVQTHLAAEKLTFLDSSMLARSDSFNTTRRCCRRLNGPNICDCRPLWGR